MFSLSLRKTTALGTLKVDLCYTVFNEQVPPLPEVGTHLTDFNLFQIVTTPK